MICIFSFNSAAYAGEIMNGYLKEANKLSDKKVKNYIDSALKKIETAKCENNINCAAATSEEYKNSPVTYADARAAIAFGGGAAMASWCGIDDRRAIIPMLKFGKEHDHMPDRYLQILNFITGEYEKIQLKVYRKQGACPIEIKQQIDAEFPKLNRPKL